VSASEGLIVWSADVPGSQDKVVALFNTTDEGPKETGISFCELGLSGGRYSVRDLWLTQDHGAQTEVLMERINAHGAGLYRIAVQ
jgi:hypothetical protein